MENTNDQLVDAWLKVTSVLMNHRMVRSMSFNEAFVCNLLNRRFQEDQDALITATWLCQMTGMLKSQMNKTLNTLEEKKIIVRRRSKQDRRKVYLFLQEDQIGLYREEHAEVLEFAECLKKQAGEVKIKETVSLLNELADMIQKIEKGETGWQYRSL